MDRQCDHCGESYVHTKYVGCDPLNVKDYQHRRGLQTREEIEAACDKAWELNGERKWS